jgi:hypothetical protein
MIKCKNCNYEWDYKGKRNHVTCPNCNGYLKLSYKYIKKICENCSKEFLTFISRQRFCCYECRKIAIKPKEAETDRKYYLKNKDKIKSHSLKRYYNNRQKILKYQIERLNKIKKDVNHPEHNKYLARHNYNTRVIKEKCEICGSKENLERHHWRYDKPRLISILCKSCHHIQHIKNKKSSRGLHFFLL